MRKAHLHAKNTALEERVAELTRDRDSLLAKLHEKTGSLETAVKNLIDKVTGHGDKLSGLAESVRVALQAHAEDKPSAPAVSATPEAAATPEQVAAPVTPIKGRKAAS